MLVRNICRLSNVFYVLMFYRGHTQQPDGCCVVCMFFLLAGLMVKALQHGGNERTTVERGRAHADEWFGIHMDEICGINIITILVLL
jgi:hypothetical protein